MDGTSYDPGAGAMGAEHPIAWCHDYDGGRAWYTGLGHTSESYSEPAFRQHLLGGIQTAAGPRPARSGCTCTGREFGLLDLALDPGFATNNWVYLYYSPAGAGPPTARR